MSLDERFPDEPGPWKLIRPNNLEAALAAADFVLVIAPETDHNLWGWATILREGGHRSLGSCPEAIELTGDKNRFGRHLRANGIPTPRIFGHASSMQDLVEMTYPAVIKPTNGAGSVDTYRVSSPAELRDRREMLVGDFLVQEYVEGEPLSGSYLVDEKGQAHRLAIGRQDMVILEGRFEYRGGEIPFRREVDEAPVLDAIQSVPGLRGFIGVDFIANPETGATSVIEINPRATTSTVGLCKLLQPGRLAEAWLAACTRLPGASVGLFGEIRRQIESKAPISFLADGTIGSASGELR